MGSAAQRGHRWRSAMTTPHRPERHLAPWLAVFVVGLGLIGAYTLLEQGSLVQTFLYDVIGAAAIVAALVGVAMHRPERAAPWLLMAFGQALFVAGDLVWNVYEIQGEDPFPSFADVLYLGGYPFIAAGLLVFIRRRVADGDRGGLLDAGILATAAAILSWTFLMQPVVADSALDPLSLWISLAYPLGDLLLIGVAVGLLTTPGARTASFRLLLVSLVALLVADHVYALQTFDGSYASGGPLDSLYLIAYITFGVSALHPTMRALTDPHPVAVQWLGHMRIACLAVAMVTGPILVVLGPDGAGPLLVPAIGTAVLSLLVLIRLAGVVGLLERDVSQRRVLEARLRHQAYHDPLTGLANRRRFVEAAEAALAARTGIGTVAALFLDLDDFKTVNDSQGHAAGDELLETVAGRIRDGLRAGDLAARLGGDEFGVLLVDVPDTAYARTVSQRLLEALDAPVRIGGMIVAVGASIGIAVDTLDMHTVDDLLGAADVAMYQAKAGGKGRHQVYTAGSETLGLDIDQAASATVTTALRSVRHAAPRLELEPG